MSAAAGRSPLFPGVVLAAAGAVVLSPVPVPVAPTVPELPRTAVPVVSVQDIDLTGIGQDIYYAITPGVQYVVGGVSYLINFIPLIGGPIAAQININYFQGVQPVVEATVNYLAAVVQNPLDIIASTQAFGATLSDIGYNWVSAELMFFGLQPLPPLPQSAATTPRTVPPSAVAAGTGAVRGSAAATAADAAVASVSVAPVTQAAAEPAITRGGAVVSGAGDPAPVAARDRAGTTRSDGSARQAREAPAAAEAEPRGGAAAAERSGAAAQQPSARVSRRA